MDPTRDLGFARAVVDVAHPADGPDRLWSAAVAPTPATWTIDSGAGWNTSVPVVYDVRSGNVLPLIDHRAPASHEQRGHSALQSPSGLELLCPSPTVAMQLADVESGRIPDHALPVTDLTAPVDDPATRAVALRCLQLTVFEAQQIARIADARVDDALLDAVLRAGPGMEYSPDFADDAVAHLPPTVVGPRTRRLVRATVVAHQLLRRSGPRRLLPRASDDDLRLALAPFVAVCGPIPWLDVPSLAPTGAAPAATIAPEAHPLQPVRISDSSTGSVVWTPMPNDPADGPRYRDVVAIAGPGATLRDAVAGVGCTHHRVTADPTVNDGLLTIGVEPAVEHDRAADLAMIDVDAVCALLASHPERASDRVCPEPSSGGRRRRWFRTGVSSSHADVELWTAARDRHDRIRTAYLAYETDPARRFEFPAVTDVRVPETAEFHRAVAVADALRTDRPPTDAAGVEAYHRAVLAASHSWKKCEQNGLRIRRAAD